MVPSILRRSLVQIDLEAPLGAPSAAYVLHQLAVGSGAGPALDTALVAILLASHLARPITTLARYASAIGVDLNVREPV